jgi:hypothetical protein
VRPVPVWVNEPMLIDWPLISQGNSIPFALFIQHGSGHLIKLGEGRDSVMAIEFKGYWFRKEVILQSLLKNCFERDCGLGSNACHAKFAVGFSGGNH